MRKARALRMDFRPVIFISQTPLLALSHGNVLRGRPEMLFPMCLFGYGRASSASFMTPPRKSNNCTNPEHLKHHCTKPIQAEFTQALRSGPLFN